MYKFVEKLPHVPRQAKATAMATKGVPKLSNGYPKEPKMSSKAAQEEEKRVEGHPKESNKSENYILIKKNT